MGFMNRSELLNGKSLVLTMEDNVNRMSKIRKAARRLELWGHKVLQIGRNMEGWKVDGEVCDANRLIYLSQEL